MSIHEGTWNLRADILQHCRPTDIIFEILRFVEAYRLRYQWLPQYGSPRIFRVGNRPGRKIKSRLSMASDAGGVMAQKWFRP